MDAAPMSGGTRAAKESILVFTFTPRHLLSNRDQEMPALPLRVRWQAHNRGHSAQSSVVVSGLAGNGSSNSWARWGGAAKLTAGPGRDTVSSQGRHFEFQPRLGSEKLLFWCEDMGLDNNALL